METVDQWAREQIGKIWGEVRENVAKIMATLIGVDGENGLRSDIKKLSERVENVETNFRGYQGQIQHYIDVQRKIDCFGLAELRRRDEVAGKEEEKEGAVKVAEINADASKSVGRWQANASFFAALASLIGILFMIVFK